MPTLERVTGGWTVLAEERHLASAIRVATGYRPVAACAARMQPGLLAVCIGTCADPIDL